MPRIPKRAVLEENGELAPRQSRLLDAMEGKDENGVIAAAAAAAAASAHAPARLRIAAGAQVRVFGHSQWRIMARTTPATGHEARLRPTRTRLWGRMVISGLVVVASSRIGSRRAGPATSLSYTDTTVQITAKYVQLRGLI